MAISEYLKWLRSFVGNAPLVIPAVTALIFDDKGKVLLQRATDDGLWHTIGGSIDPGEEPADAAIREALEETGLRIHPEHLSGVYTDPPITYSNGDVALYIGLAFRCKVLDGETLAISDDESLELRFFDIDDLPPLAPHEIIKIMHAYSFQGQTFFETTTK